MPVNIPEWGDYRGQFVRLGCHTFNVARLVELSRNLPVFEAPLNTLNIYYVYEKLTLREMVMHMKAVMSADLNYPIILDEDGDLMDGRHRVMAALYRGDETIKAVRFDRNPTPDKIEDL